MAIARGAIDAVARRGTAVLAALVVCACASKEKPKEPEENIYPADYRDQVAGLVRRQTGSGTVRDAYIAEPVVKAFLPTPRYVACVRFSTGGGAGPNKGGSKDYAAYFYAGKITQVVGATVEQCDKAAYMPFTELAQ